MIEEPSTVILIVDDEADLCEILSLRFEMAGFTTLTANNGKQALEIVRARKVDLIISDIQMPGGNGVELLDEVRKLNPTLPLVLFMTGFSDITVEDAYDKGADAVFTKPFDHKALLETVKRALAENKENHRPLRSLREKTDLRIEVKFPQFEISKKVEMKNIGRGGFFISLNENFPKVGDSILFTMEIDGELTARIKGAGIVKWIRPMKEDQLLPGCGMEFKTFEGSGKTKILEFVNLLKTKQYIPKN